MTEKYNIYLVCPKQNTSELEKRNKELSTSPMDSFVKKEDMPT
jgi:hypothetical protein